MPGFLDTASASEQDEAIYIAFFDRAADGPGLSYWTGQTLGPNGWTGPAPTITMTQVANSFAVQPEANSLGLPLPDPTDPFNSAIVTAFIQNVYSNLFSRQTDAAGLAYWQGQISSGAVSLGDAVVAIANGAQSSDANRLAWKIEAAITFTEETATAGIDPSNPTFIAAAHAAVVNVIDVLSANSSMLASYDYTHPGANVQVVGQAHTDGHHPLHR